MARRIHYPAWLTSKSVKPRKPGRAAGRPFVRYSFSAGPLFGTTVFLRVGHPPLLSFSLSGGKYSADGSWAWVAP